MFLYKAKKILGDRASISSIFQKFMEIVGKTIGNMGDLVLGCNDCSEVAHNPRCDSKNRLYF